MFKSLVLCKIWAVWFNLLKVQSWSCKLCNNKYMIASTQITNTCIFAFIVILVFKLLSHIFIYIFKQQKIAHFTGKVLQNYKWFECEIFKILLKHVSNHLSVLLQLSWPYLYMTNIFSNRFFQFNKFFRGHAWRLIVWTEYNIWDKLTW